MAGGWANLIEEVKTLPQATQLRIHFKFDICYHILSAVLFTKEDVKICDKVCLKPVKVFCSRFFTKPLSQYE